MRKRTDVIVRRARLADVEAIAALERAAFGADAYPRVFLRQAIDLWPDLICVADDSASILGHALAAPARSPYEAWILTAAVHSEARRGGIGSALMEYLLDRLRHAGFRRVALTVHPENHGAVRLYTDLGFAVEVEEAAYFGPGEPRIRMGLSLQGDPERA